MELIAKLILPMGLGWLLMHEHGLLEKVLMGAVILIVMTVLT